MNNQKNGVIHHLLLIFQRVWVKLYQKKQRMNPYKPRETWGPMQWEPGHKTIFSSLKNFFGNQTSCPQPLAISWVGGLWKKWDMGIGRTTLDANGFFELKKILMVQSHVSESVWLLWASTKDQELTSPRRSAPLWILLLSELYSLLLFQTIGLYLNWTSRMTFFKTT